MKHTNQCPKCQSFDILLISGHAGAYGTGNNIMTGSTIFSAVPVNRYLCANCGYSEEWINTEDIPKLIKKYQKKK